MATTYAFFHDSALTSAVGSGNPITALQDTINSLAPVDVQIWFGSATASRKARASSNPGVDQIAVTISDSATGSGEPASAVKLATSQGGLDSATAGASLNIGTQVLSGSGTFLISGASTPVNYWVELLPGIIIFGLGLSITVAPLTSAILGSIQPSQAGIGSAVNNAVARIAGLLAIAVIGVFIGTAMTSSGFRTGLYLCSVLLVGGGVVSAVGIRNKQVSQD